MGVNNNIDMVSIIRESLLSGNGPRYKRIAQALEQEINQGRLSEGTKLQPHRIMGDALGVTSGTVSKAYAELEKTGLVRSRVGDGTYVCGQEYLKHRDNSFRNILMSDRAIDLSRNTHISMDDISYTSDTLKEMAHAPQTLRQLLEYTPETGLPHHRQAGLEWFKYSQATGNDQQVICTNGAQHALLCILLACVKPGGTVVTELVSYPGLIELARNLGIRLIGLDMDEGGLSVEALETFCKSHNVTAVYCTPTLQNPTTRIMPPEQRQALANVCRQYNVLIIEDDVHGALVSDRPPALQYYAPERTLLFTSLSKVLSGGVRVGYILAPTSLLSRLTSVMRTTCWMATPLTHELASRWILEGVAARIRERQRQEIHRRKEMMAPLLEGLNYHSHPDCPHFWIEVPETWRATEIEQQLATQQVLVKSSEAFAVGRQAIPQFIRASISVADNDHELAVGFQRLQETMLEM